MREWCAEGDIWAYEGGSDRTLEEIASLSFVICATNPRRYIKQLLWAGHEVRMWEKRQAVGKHKGKRQRV